MKILLLILFSTVAIAQQTDFYVDGDNAGLGDSTGVDWTNAWHRFADIEWDSLGAGDTLFISGSTDSVQYSEQMIVGGEGSWNNPLVIIAGKYSSSPSGHSGRAIIDGDSTRAIGLWIDNKYWVTVKGLEIRHHYGGGNAGLHLHHLTGRIVIDSCDIYENAGFGLIVQPSDPPGGGGQQSDISGEDSTELAWYIEVKNCRFWTYANNSNPATCDDLIQMKIVKGVRVHDNFFWNRNKQIGVDPGSHAHQDGIQVYISRDVRIWNNVFVFDSAALGHPILIGGQTGASNLDTNIIYNNFIAHGGDLGAYSLMSIYVQSVTPYLAPTFIYHNTIVAWNGRADCLMQEEPNAPYWYTNNLNVRNNIMVQMGTNKGAPPSGAHPVWRAGDRINFVDSVTNNLMWSYHDGNIWEGDDNTWITAGKTDTLDEPNDWADWVNNYGGTGVSGNPDFVADYYAIRDSSGVGYRLSSDSPAIDAGGTDVQAFIEDKDLPWTDIEGQTRDNSPDIGCFEYQSEGEEVTGSTKLILKK